MALKLLKDKIALLTTSRFLLALLTSLTTLSSAMAQSQSTESLSTNTSTIALPDDETQEPKSKFHALISLTTSSNLYKDAAYERSVSNELVLLPSYNLTEKLTASLRSIITQEKGAGEDQTSVSNTRLRFTQKLPNLTENTKTNISVAGLAPTNKDSIQTDKFKGAFVLGSGLSWNVEPFEAHYNISLQRNIHEYTQNADGKFNTQTALTHVLGGEYSLNDKWSISLEGSFRQGWTYKDNVSESYDIGSDVNYVVSKTLTASAGYSSEGAAFKPNGSESNIQLYDSNAASVHFNLTFSN